MPLYEFCCKDCGEEYEALTKFDKTRKYKSVECPKCESKNRTLLLGHSFAFKFTNPEGTDLWRKHDYRFHHNLPKVIKEREMAEKASHMGKNPYKDIDDTKNDKTFGKL